ncbi:MAG: type I methionyl aminopeptidase [Kofleriaceae bacterium]
MRIQYKTDHEITLQRAAGLVAAEILEAMCQAAQVGASTWELDQIARAGIARTARAVDVEVMETARALRKLVESGRSDTKAEIERLTRTYSQLKALAKPHLSGVEIERVIEETARYHRVTSAFLGYADPPYPAVVCTSINEVIVHGIPNKAHVLRDGDIIGIDFGIYKHGFCADTARTIMVGNVSEENRKLVAAAKEALDRGITQIRVDHRLGDVGHAIQTHAESQGYSVVRAFVGHGTGRQMHEDPQVHNYGKPGTEKRIKTGLVIAVEPMVNAGAPELEVLDDGWTAVTRDRKMSAHFEHTIAVTDKGPWVLTDPASQKP